MFGVIVNPDHLCVLLAVGWVAWSCCRSAQWFSALNRLMTWSCPRVWVQWSFFRSMTSLSLVKQVPYWYPKTENRKDKNTYTSACVSFPCILSSSPLLLQLIMSQWTFLAHSSSPWSADPLFTLYVSSFHFLSNYLACDWTPALSDKEAHLHPNSPNSQWAEETAEHLSESTVVDNLKTASVPTLRLLTQQTRKSSNDHIPSCFFVFITLQETVTTEWDLHSDYTTSQVGLHDLLREWRAVIDTYSREPGRYR